jgi:hypothetical protein
MIWIINGVGIHTSCKQRDLHTLPVALLYIL